MLNKEICIGKAENTEFGMSPVGIQIMGLPFAMSGLGQESSFF